MITVAFSTHPVDVPYTERMTLITAIRAGVKKMRADGNEIRFEGLGVRVNGTRMTPQDSDNEIADGSLISLIDAHRNDPERFFTPDQVSAGGRR